ncbi:hypothetical protein KIW84_044663 [Lathyrus oleraceus]|uniref:Uncharacterized protein n=1 Tax=Pisum sativum TaxID=3888 RepID=A0A9D5AQN7_PEA|nr:hypothetical protein KIW84_044663 [Pisum sativum]
MVKETRNGSNKMRDWIRICRLISDILFESKLLQKLMDIGMTKEVDFVNRKNFSGHTLKNMSLIINVINPSELLDRASIFSRRTLVDDYPLFSKDESKEVLELYIIVCLVMSFPLGVASYEELPHHPINESSRTATKVVRTYGLNILRATMSPKAEFIRSKTARSSKVTASMNHGNSPMTETLFYSASFVMYTS